MLRQHIDFFAVLAIALVITVVSQARVLRFPADSFRVERIYLNARPCPETQRALGRISSLFDR
jgi:hypothetical protein